MEVLTKVTAHLSEIFHVYVPSCCMKCYVGNERSSIASALKDFRNVAGETVYLTRNWGSRCEG